ncbi:hypothetical protein PGT21_005966 [Puccinia graminis f. sp. tritici]|uniref:Uncharacterized protein n=1 Tax=Puccinia graminis f. sp. tritici TaxID=56615 RepID=A0A5B0M5A5_PUCGR|nr:hypothetical protein PGT21_005966 [Puccinia graminis f. sp. tritici]KAA1123136.1 hypothetical protein PGTUg99_014150 [Puccinia graminis f. sp. tritici]
MPTPLTAGKLQAPPSKARFARGASRQPGNTRPAEWMGFRRKSQRAKIATEQVLENEPRRKRNPARSTLFALRYVHHPHCLPLLHPLNTSKVTWCDSAAAQPAGGDYIRLLRATPTGIHTAYTLRVTTGYEPAIPATLKNLEPKNPTGLIF